MNRQLVIGIFVGALAVTTFGAVAGYRMMDQKEFAAVLSVKPVTDSVSEAAGYDVVYRFRGRDEAVRMDHDPGRQIPIENGAPVLQR